MDYIQKTLERYNEKVIELNADYGTDEYRKILLEALTEQASLFRQGLGEEEKPFVHSYKYERENIHDALVLTPDQAGSNQRLHQTLEKWKEAGL